MNGPDYDPYYGLEARASQAQAADQAPYDESNLLSHQVRTAESFAPLPVYGENTRVEGEVGEDSTDMIKPDEVGSDILADDKDWMDWINYGESIHSSTEQTSQDTLASTREAGFAETPRWQRHPNKTCPGTITLSSSLQASSEPEPTPNPLLSSNSLPASRVPEPTLNPLLLVGDQFPQFLNTTNEDFLLSPLQTPIVPSAYNHAENGFLEGAIDLTRPASPEDDYCSLQRSADQSQFFAPSRMDYCPPSAAASRNIELLPSSIELRLAHRPRHLKTSEELTRTVSPLAEALQDRGDHEQSPPLLRLDNQYKGVQRQRSWSCRDIEQVVELDTVMDVSHGLIKQGKYPQPPVMRPPEINVPPAETTQQSTLDPRLTRGLSSADNSLLSPYSTTPYSPFLAPLDSHESIRFYTRSTSNPTTPGATTTTSSRIVPLSSPPSPSPSISSVRSLDSALQCPVCHKDISNSKKYKDRKSNLRRHMRVKHGHGPKPTCSEPGCGKVFERSDALAKHRKNHHRL
ncbi:hypothetical protein N7G274_005598 [Stereocaulon virgatum]|uniref:C2H2-type domain-containing protein n=1 Tax=Stereocaulon virgatum TaxID=373712 RepID=A0ABR4A8J3_9LECA